MSGTILLGRLVLVVALQFLAWVAAGAFWPVLRTKRGGAAFFGVGLLAAAGAWFSRGVDGFGAESLRSFAVVWVVTIGLLAFVVGPLAMLRWMWVKVRGGASKSVPAVESADLPDPSRRALLHFGAVLPVGAATTGGVGTLGSGRFVVREEEVRVKGLPAALDGFRIGQTTDVHVGAFITVDELREALAALDAAGVDLHVMTGDLIDDPEELDATIAALGAVTAPLGVRAILGNHEHWMSRMATERAYAKADPKRVRLLVNERETIEWKGARLTVAGVDYPLRSYGPRDEVEEQFARDTLDPIPAGETTLLLAHHPDFFTIASKRKVALQLSGHTHGGQVGIFGKSLTGFGFRYPLGRYAIGDSHLYVSGGTGHWFPFRLGVPREVTVLTLRAA